MEQILKSMESLPMQKEMVQKTDIQLAKKQEEISHYHRLKKSLYESMLEGLIDKSEYFELKAVKMKTLIYTTNA